MSNRLIYIFLLVIILPLKSRTQTVDDIIRIINRGVEIAEWVEIAAVLTSSEDNLEYWLNKTVDKQVKKENKYYTSDVLTAIGNKLVAKCERPFLPNGLTYQFYIIDANYYNAFAVPGGAIYITKALFDILNEDEIAFVLGHEIGHICKKHSIKAVKQSNAFLAVQKVALKVIKADQNVEQLLALLASATYITIQAGFSREWEREVDIYGLHLLNHCQYKPKGSVDALSKLADATDSWSSCCFLWDTHPAMIERVQLLNAEIAVINNVIPETPIVISENNYQTIPVSSPNNISNVNTLTENEISKFANPSYDVIIINDKSALKTNVIEINDKTVRYINFEQPNGPIRNEPIENVILVIYKNGKREVINKSYQISNISSPIVTYDIIYKKDGTEIKSKILEINSQTVKYKNINQPDGPIRNVLITDVQMIIYSGGSKRTF